MSTPKFATERCNTSGSEAREMLYAATPENFTLVQSKLILDLSFKGSIYICTKTHTFKRFEFNHLTIKSFSRYENIIFVSEINIESNI